MYTSPPTTTTPLQSHSRGTGSATGSTGSGTGRGGTAPGTTTATSSGSGQQGSAVQGGRAGGGGGGRGGDGDRLADKACKKCRTRKVKCDRRWPQCARCRERGEECDFGRMVPAGVLPDLTGDGRIAELEAKVASLESELSTLRLDSSLPTPETFPLSIRNAYVSGTERPDGVADFFYDTLTPEGVGVGAGWELAQKALARALSLHLIDSFFSSCCAYLPIFAGWHERLGYIHENIDNLDPASRVAVAGFCSMGARASPHSALLGITVPSPETSPTPQAVIVAGSRRELACRAIHKRAIKLCQQLEIAHYPTVMNLEALMVKLQMLAFEELVPVRSRTLLRVALGQFKDLKDSDLSLEVKKDVVERLGLPLFLADAQAASYARKPPMITPSDLASYFAGSGVTTPDFTTDNLSAILDAYIPAVHESPDWVNHEGLTVATTIVACWIAGSQRDFAGLATPQSIPTNLIPARVYNIWSGLDQVHSSIQRIQQLLVNISYTPPGCESEGCTDLHLRFDTRLDRDLMDVNYLIHVFLTDKLKGVVRLEGPATPTSDWKATLLQESERRVRRALKLVAFYSQLYITSRDPHMTYHLAWQLELLPNWTALAVQRYGEAGGPIEKDLELTEKELDWYIKGLRVASFYHPSAERRLHELEAWRRVPSSNQYL